MTTLNCPHPTTPCCWQARGRRCSVKSASFWQTAGNHPTALISISHYQLHKINETIWNNLAYIAQHNDPSCPFQLIIKCHLLFCKSTFIDNKKQFTIRWWVWVWVWGEHYAFQHRHTIKQVHTAPDVTWLPESTNIIFLYTHNSQTRNFMQALTV